LRAYQSILPAIRDLGAELVAISSQLPDHSLSTAEKNELEFELLSDLGNVVARRFGLVYPLDDELRKIYAQSFHIELPEFNGDDSWELAVPGTFVLDRRGTVRLAFADPDYTRRLEPAAIVDALGILAPFR
jgi:peroxiredoxin